MHRLCRQFSCPSRCSRVLRVQPPSSARRALSSSLRRYASSGSPSVPNDKFDRLFASLRHGMTEDELAKTIASLVLSTKNENRLSMIETSVPKYIKSFNRQSLYTKVNHYLTNPPEDDPTPSGMLASSLEGDSQMSLRATKSHLEQDMETAPTEEYWMEIEDYDPSLPDPSDQLMAHLQTPDVRRILQQLDPKDQVILRDLLLLVGNGSEEEEITVLNRIAYLLSHHGVGIQYRLQGKDKEEETLMAEMRALELEKLENAEELEDGDRDAEEIPDYRKDYKAAEDYGGDENDDIDLGKGLPSHEPASVNTTELSTPGDNIANPVGPQQEEDNDPFPDLMTPDPLLDSRDVLDFPPGKDNPYHNQVTVRNHTSIFTEAAEAAGFDFNAEDYVPTKTDETEESANSRENLPLAQSELSQLYRFPLIRRRITQQTGKGKIHRQFVLMVVGNGNGLVGYGQGKDEDAPSAESKAFAQAVRNMDWVERFEDRTIWTDINTKLGATQLIMRPRPVGFGLRCNPNLHQVLKAAGIKDISAKVWGSRNPINVIKAAFRVLQAGHAPLAMGDGIGGPGRKLNKGSGLRSKSDVERERGRQLISLRK